ncbi:MAG: M48 family metallopeptidase [Armatimonadetes bacterium]|nr:M48 family metallopeptidase [Armatimonadota bacterium]
MRTTFWNEIAANKRSSAFLSFLMTLLLAGVGAAGTYLIDPELWPFGAAIAFLIGVILWVYTATSGHKAVLAISRARQATHEENQVVVNVAHEMAIAAGIPMPEVHVIEDSAPNAFATGMGPQSGVICVTTGLLQKLNRDELQGVVAHEMGHIRNYDIRLMTTMALTVGVIVLLRDFFVRINWHGGGRRRGKDGGQAIVMVIALVFIILAPIFAMLLNMAISRKREFLADATAAQLTRYPDALADALEKISTDPEELEAANNATAPMYIINPVAKLRSHERSNLFSTHPATAERVRRLRQMGMGPIAPRAPAPMPEIPMQRLDD